MYVVFVFQTSVSELLGELVDHQPEYVEHEHRNQQNNKKAAGVTYICPFGRGCYVNQSRLSQHVKRHHKDLLKSKEMVGGGNLTDLVQQIKVHTQRLFPQPLDTKPCSICELYVHKSSMLRHMMRAHGVGKDEASIRKQLKKERNMQNVFQELKEAEYRKTCRYADHMVEDFEVFLCNFGGGSKAASTAKSAASALNKILVNAALKPTIIKDRVICLDIINESNREGLDTFLSSEVTRVKIGFRNTVTALGHFYRFIKCRKQVEVEMAGLQTSLRSFGSSVEGWQDSATKFKRSTNAEARDRLDENYKDFIDSGRVAKLHECLKHLEKDALACNDLLSPKVALYLQAQICFGSGNFLTSYYK